MQESKQEFTKFVSAANNGGKSVKYMLSPLKPVELFP